MIKKKKSVKLPPQRDSAAQAYNDFTVVLEALQSDFKAFGEAQILQGEKIETLEKRLILIQEKVDRLGLDIVLMKAEIKQIREALKEKPGPDRLLVLEQRVERLKQAIV